MKKKILIGSLLVLTLLLLMPSIPAVQQKTIDEGIKQEIQEKIDSITLDDLKYIDVLDDIRHPILYYLFWLFINFRIERCWKLFDIAVTIEYWHAGSDIIINHPLLFLRCLMLSGITLFMLVFMMDLSYYLGWGWGNPQS